MSGTNGLLAVGTTFLLGASSAAFAGDVVFSEDFEAYTVGTDIVGQGGWEFWGGGGSSPSGRISDAMVHGGEKSLVIRGNADGALQDDIVYQHNLVGAIYDYAAWQYIPAEAGGGQTMFILLNQYDGGGAGTNWSTQLVIDPDAGTCVSQFLGTDQPFTVGQWNRIRVRANLMNDSMDVFVNDDVIEAGRLWTDGNFSSGPGILQLAAVDLYGGTGPYDVFYDDLEITEVPPNGACCLLDGTCVDGLLEDDCLALEGANNFVGPGTECATSQCQLYGTDGWELDAPFTFAGDTTRFPTECDFGSNDERFVVTIPYAAPWTFSLCTGTAFDTYLAVGSSPCAEDLASNDDACGVQSEITLDLEPGVVYVTVTSLFAEEGEFTLIASAPCIASVETAGDPETEPCGDDSNGGCNMTVPAYEPIALGQTKAGTNWYDGATRDTDWYEYTNQDGLLRWAFIGRPFDEDILLCDSGYNDYEVTIDQAAPGGETTMTVTCENVTVFGMIADADGNPSTDCALVSGISPFFTTDPCNGVVTRMGVIEPGEASCTPTDGDTNDDGIVDVSDLLNVLADWGCSGAPGACLGDVNCDGVTNVSDLLDVLANWD